MSENHKFVEIIKKDIVDILDLDLLDIDIDTSVFDLGFNSLTTIQLVRKVKTRFNIDLPLVLFFENCTVNKMAELIQNILNDKK